MNIISLGSERMAMSFDTLEISINEVYYDNLTFIIRLLTYDELIRVNSIKTSDAVINLVIEEDIYELTLIEIVGIEEEVNINTMEAGVISTISGAIINSSNFYFSDVQAAIEKEASESSIFNQMQLVVAKNYNINFKDVINMPVDELVRKFSLFQATFPSEALAFNREE